MPSDTLRMHRHTAILLDLQRNSMQKVYNIHIHIMYIRTNTQTQTFRLLKLLKRTNVNRFNQNSKPFWIHTHRHTHTNICHHRKFPVSHAKTLRKYLRVVHTSPIWINSWCSSLIFFHTFETLYISWTYIWCVGEKNAEPNYKRNWY